MKVLADQCLEFYGERLTSVVVYGSAGRGAMRPDSDIDFLLVADPLPKGRMRRVREFDSVEQVLKPLLAGAQKGGVTTVLSPVFKTPDEVLAGSPLFLDMIEDARILFDRDDFFRQALDGLRERLARLGAKRIWMGSAWYWDLKPDYRCGEEFEI